MAKTALVTGASAGLGAEFARQLAARRMDLILVARRGDRLLALRDEVIAAHGVEVETITADLSDRDAPEAVFAAVAGLGARVDYLVNNAGAGGPELLEDDWSVLAPYLELMMTSVAHLCHLFAQPMRERGFGRIVNVSSVAGRMARRGDVTYGPAKTYVIALSEALDLTLAPWDVRCLALCPGFTHTDFHDDAAALASMKAATPGFVWYDASVVVSECLAALDKGRRIAVSGRLYRLLDPLMQWRLTRRLLQGSRYADRRGV